MDKSTIASRMKLSALCGRKNHAAGKDIFKGTDPFLCKSLCGCRGKRKDRPPDRPSGSRTFDCKNVLKEENGMEELQLDAIRKQTKDVLRELMERQI